MTTQPRTQRKIQTPGDTAPVINSNAPTAPQLDAITINQPDAVAPVADPVDIATLTNDQIQIAEDSEDSKADALFDTSPVQDVPVKVFTTNDFKTAKMATNQHGQEIGLIVPEPPQNHGG